MEAIVWVALAVFSTGFKDIQIITSEESFKSKEDCEVVQEKAKTEIMKVGAIKAFGLSCVPVKIKTKYDA